MTLPILQLRGHFEWYLFKDLHHWLPAPSRHLPSLDLMVGIKHLIHRNRFLSCVILIIIVLDVVLTQTDVWCVDANLLFRIRISISLEPQNDTIGKVKLESSFVAIFHFRLKKRPKKKWMATVKITHWNRLNLHLDMFVYPFQSQLLESFPSHHHLETPQKNAKHPHLRQQSRSRPKPKVWPKRRPRKASCHGVLSRSFLSLFLRAALKIKIMKVPENTSFLEDAFFTSFYCA